jgi:hypothetical protein
MRPKLHCVALTERECEQLLDVVSTGRGSARTLAHARILLKADQGRGGPAWPDAAIAEAVEASEATVARGRRQDAEAGLEAALNWRAPQREYRRKLDGAPEAHGSRWPVGHRWQVTGAGAGGCWSRRLLEPHVD